MTYKNIIKGIVERESATWIESFIIKEEGIRKFASIDYRKTEIKIEDGDCYFSVIVDVLGDKIPIPAFRVGGTVSEDGYVYKSVIYDYSGEVVWMATEEGREIFNITSFEIK